MGLPNITYTDQYILDGKRAVASLSNFYSTMVMKDIDRPDQLFRVPMDDFFIRYRIPLSEIVIEYECPDNMFYQPKTVSYHLYNTTEMWMGLMRLNNMKNITEFIEPIIKVYQPDPLFKLMDIFFKRERVIK